MNKIKHIDGLSGLEEAMVVQELNKSLTNSVKTSKVGGMKVTKITETPLTKVFSDSGIIFCPICRKGFTDIEHVESIKKIGECLNCDHVRQDSMNDEQLPF